MITAEEFCSKSWRGLDLLLIVRISGDALKISGSSLAPCTTISAIQVPRGPLDNTCGT